MITREEWVDVVSLHRQGLSIRAISARLAVTRNTVRAALRRDGHPSPSDTRGSLVSLRWGDTSFLSERPISTEGASPHDR